MAARKPATDPLDAPVESLEGVGPTRAKELHDRGVHTLGDLVEYFPRAYQLEREETSIASLASEGIQTARGEVVACDYLASRPRPRFEATLQDDTGKLGIVFFNGAYLRSRIRPGMHLRVKGKTRFFHNMPQMANPRWEAIDPQAAMAADAHYRPIYSVGGKLTSEMIQRIIQSHLPSALGHLEEYYDAALLKRRSLIERSRAYHLIHTPAGPKDASTARRRLIYDELMLLQLGLGLSRKLRSGRISAPVLRADKTLDDRIRSRFPFPLTTAQQHAVWDIVRDLQTGEPMHRLVQGDVGSGKTVVAVYAMLIAVANKMQSAILSPTEVLAEQHFLTLSRMLEGSSVQLELVTSRTRRASRGAVDRRLKEGKTHIAIGTQALLQQGIEFANLGLVVVDEQHRLGVLQRAGLKAKGYTPHYLVMTATPIPRTLALSYFADFDVSVIDELPPGRRPVMTRHLPQEQSDDAWRLVKSQAGSGRQAYIVVPQIAEGLDDARSVVAEHDRLKKGPLAGLRLGMLHGELPTDEKNQMMDAFRAGRIDVLVSTTVIEVGVDVPNATVIVIQNADRFGLSQLHQLRGRVGRGEFDSYCILVGDANTPDARTRLDTLCRTGDGFKIAEVDLQLRGPGEFFGTRQHGLPEMKLADVTSELELLQQARDDAVEILRRDPLLTSDSNAAIRQALDARFGPTLGLAAVG